MFQQITILGPGLLGASLAMAARHHGLATRINAWSRRKETRVACAQQEWCDSVDETPELAVKESDLVVLCTPVETIPSLLRVISSHLKPDTLLTDVGSTKRHICESAPLALPQSAHFVGSHPMAGSEQTGMAHARKNLFENAACFVTPLATTDTEATRRIVEFWKTIGTQVTKTDPAQHDAIVAHVSHLPHLLASTLCTYLHEKPTAWAKASGNGLKDTTRIASGDAELWRQILEENREEVLTAVNGFKNQLTDIESALLSRDSGALKSSLTTGKAFRDQLNGRLKQ